MVIYFVNIRAKRYMQLRLDAILTAFFIIVLNFSCYSNSIDVDLLKGCWQRTEGQDTIIEKINLHKDKRNISIKISETDSCITNYKGITDSSKPNSRFTAYSKVFFLCNQTPRIIYWVDYNTKIVYQEEILELSKNSMTTVYNDKEHKYTKVKTRIWRQKVKKPRRARNQDLNPVKAY